MTGKSKAYAKINLSLDIIEKMQDGYHSMEMVMQTISLCDEITIDCNIAKGLKVRNGEHDGEHEGEYIAGLRGSDDSVDLTKNIVEVSTNLDFVPSDNRNIAAKAATAFFAYTGISGYKTRIEIDKNIPVCAGLGGGSADAAGVLRMLDEMFETKLGTKVLEDIGLKIGADVPFCIEGGTKLAKGRGEVLTTLSPLPQCYVVVCKPDFSCSTPECFSLVDCRKIRARPDTCGIVSALDSGDLTNISKRLYNVFEDFMPRGKSELDEIKGVMLGFGALGASMTGSGPSVFGIFESNESADKAYRHLKDKYDDCFVATPV